MQNLKRLTIFCILLYVVFALMNVFESCWYGHIFRHRSDFLISRELQVFSSWMRKEVSVHYWLNIFSYIILFVFLVFCNQLVKRYQLGKGYHILIVLLGFLPVANWFLLYMIWRKLNRAFFKSTGKNSRRSDQLIIWIWISTLIGTVSPLFVPLFNVYSGSPESISMVIYYSSFSSLVHSVYLLIVSFLFLFYFLGFKRILDSSKNQEELLVESQLLDD